MCGNITEFVVAVSPHGHCHTAFQIEVVLFLYPTVHWFDLKKPYPMKSIAPWQLRYQSVAFQDEARI